MIKRNGKKIASLAIAASIVFQNVSPIMALTDTGEENKASDLIISEYLKQNQYRPERIAIELNGSILPKSAYNSTILKDGDVMEIVSFVGGG